MLTHLDWLEIINFIMVNSLFRTILSACIQWIQVCSMYKLIGFETPVVFRDSCESWGTSDQNALRQ